MEGVKIPHTSADDFPKGVVTLSSPWIPSPLEMEKKGILFSKFTQHPGDCVYTGYGAIHWVFCPVSISIILLFYLFYLIFFIEWSIQHCLELCA